MSSRQIFRLLISAVVGINLGLIQARAQSQISYAQYKQKQIRIREVASVKARADTAYLLMTVQTERSQLMQAYRDNQKQLKSFIDALLLAGIPREAMRVRNFVVTPTDYGRGFNLSRNLVITVENVDLKPPAEFSRLMAQMQDLGARFGSDCITCIGSG